MRLSSAGIGALEAWYTERPSTSSLPAPKYRKRLPGKILIFYSFLDSRLQRNVGWRKRHEL